LLQDQSAWEYVSFDDETIAPAGIRQLHAAAI